MERETPLVLTLTAGVLFESLLQIGQAAGYGKAEQQRAHYVKNFLTHSSQPKLSTTGLANSVTRSVTFTKILLFQYKREGRTPLFDVNTYL